MKNLKSIFFATTLAVLASCSSDDTNVIEVPLGAYDNGIFILNEGNLGSSNASISFLSSNLQTSQVNSFTAVNPNITLGGVGNDMTFSANYAYVVMNGSNTIQIMNRFTLKHVGSLNQGLNSPRSIILNGAIAYVSNWGDPNVTTDDYISVFNLSTQTNVATIPVSEGPENMIFNNNFLFVAQKGGYGFGNKITVINTLTYQITKTITVGDVPDSMKKINNTLYVLSSGNPSYAAVETQGKLTKINLITQTVESEISFGTTFHPTNLCALNNDLFYNEGNNIYTIPTTATTAPTTALINGTTKNITTLYSLEVANGLIFTGDALNYNSNGKVKIFDLAGTLVKETECGITPTGFYFNL